MQLINKDFIIFAIVIGIFIIFSGCILHQQDNTTKSTPLIQQSPVVISHPSSSERYWIQIDPITDYKTDSSFNITGSTKLTVKGTTDFPVGTVLRLAIIERNSSRDVVRTNIEVQSNNSGPNTFSYVYDMKGNPPGRYQVGLADSVNLNTAVSFFNITSDTSFYKWIRMNPLGEVHIGKNIPVSGTTDLPAGSEILIRSDIVAHSCTSHTPDNGWQRTYCGGSCRDVGSQHTILVFKGTGGVNIWNSTVNTTDWCQYEEFWIGAFAINWTNVTPGGQSIRLI